MSSPPRDTPRLSIRKYSNRRFYDATRRCTVTLSDLHDLICRGYELTITDASTGDDITHAVLMQIILERDPLKLAILPANILHEMIRTQQRFLGGVFEQLLRQIVEAQRVSQDRWNDFLRSTLGVLPGAPLDWAQAVSAPWMPRPAAATHAPSMEPSAPANPQSSQDELERLRRQVADLTRRIEQVATPRPRTATVPRAVRPNRSRRKRGKP